MTYGEKRELRLQISQLLADAGLNQATVKQIVEEETRNKVDKVIDNLIKKNTVINPNDCGSIGGWSIEEK